MSDAVATPTVTKTWSDSAGFHAIGTLAVGESPLAYATGGIVLNFASSRIHTHGIPISVDIRSRNGYQYAYIPGTGLKDGLLKILVSTTQASAAAIPAGVSGDVITFHAVWPGM